MNTLHITDRSRFTRWQAKPRTARRDRSMSARRGRQFFEFQDWLGIGAAP